MLRLLRFRVEAAADPLPRAQDLQLVSYVKRARRRSQLILPLSSQLFNEIMPTIYARFTEKEARQWRQIYKALVLLE
jgi:hypothetical protein